MNTLIPSVERTKATGAFTLFIFSLWLLFFSYKGVFPDFNSTGTYFGILFLTLIPTTALISIVGILRLGKIQEILVLLVSKLFVPILIKEKHVRIWLKNTSDGWVDGQIKSLQENPHYRLLRDGEIAQFYYGVTVLIFGYIIKNSGDALLESLITFKNSSTETPILDSAEIGWGSAVLLIIGAIIVFSSFVDSIRNKRHYLNLIWHQNIRNMSGDDRDRIIDANQDYLRVNNWDGFDAELRRTVLKPIIEYFNKYLDALNLIDSLILHDEKDDTPMSIRGFSGFLGEPTESGQQFNWLTSFSKGSYVINNYMLGQFQISSLHCNTILFGSTERYSYISKPLSGAIFGITQLDELLINICRFLFIDSLDKRQNYSFSIYYYRTDKDVLPIDITSKDILTSQYSLLVAWSLGSWFLSDGKSTKFVILENATQKIFVEIDDKLMRPVIEKLQKTITRSWYEIRLHEKHEGWKSAPYKFIRDYLDSASRNALSFPISKELVTYFQILKDEIHTKPIGDLITQLKDMRIKLINQIQESKNHAKEWVTKLLSECPS